MSASPDYTLEASDRNVRSFWDNSIDPVLTVQSGETVLFKCRDAHNGQITSDTTAADIRGLDSDPIHPLTGPVAVENLSAGNVLQIDFIDFRHHGHGYSLFYADDKGLLPGEFDTDGLYHWNLEGDIGYFSHDITINLDPFPGVVGVAPEADGRHSTIPPRRTGGNMDIKHLTEGSTLYLPVEVDGGLLSIGDCHAAQGDGEVCVTGIEAPMDVTARLSKRTDLSISQPRFETAHPFTHTGSDEPMTATTGIADNLMDASRGAIRQMIDHLHSNHDLTKSEAYILCSAVVDLKINELVNDPNYVVSAYLPDSIFN